MPSDLPPDIQQAQVERVAEVVERRREDGSVMQRGLMRNGKQIGLWTHYDVAGNAVLLEMFGENGSYLSVSFQTQKNGQVVLGTVEADDRLPRDGVSRRLVPSQRDKCVIVDRSNRIP